MFLIFNILQHELGIAVEGHHSESLMKSESNSPWVLLGKTSVVAIVSEVMWSSYRHLYVLVL